MNFYSSTSHCCYAILFLLFCSCNNHPEFSSSASGSIPARDTITTLRFEIEDTAMARIYLDSADILMDSTLYTKALELCHKSKEIYRLTVGELDSLFASTLKLESKIHHKVENYELALQTAKRALSIAQKSWQDDQLSLAPYIELLGKTYYFVDSVYKALELLNRSLLIRSNNEGNHQQSLEKSLLPLGYILVGKGEYEQGKLYLEKAAVLIKASTDNEKADLVTIYSLLAAIELNNGRYSEILAYVDEAKKVIKEITAKSQLFLVSDYHRLAQIEGYLGNFNSALELNLTALNIIQSFPNPDSSQLADIYNTLGAINKEKGFYKEELEYYKKAIAIKQQMYGKLHPELITPYMLLADYFLDRARNLDSASYYMLLATNMGIEEYGENSLMAASFYHQLGNLYDYKRDEERASFYYEKGLTIYENELGKDNYNTASIAVDLADIKESQGLQDQAIPIYENSLTVFKNSLNEDHPEVARLHNILGNVYRFEAQYEKAKFHYQNAIKIYEKVYGKDGIDLAIIYMNLSFFHGSLEEYDTSLDFLQKALKLQIMHLGEKHPNIAFNYLSISDVLYAKANQKIQSIDYEKKAIEALNYDVNHPRNFAQVTELWHLFQAFINIEFYYKGQYVSSGNDIYLDSLSEHYVNFDALQEYMLSNYVGSSERQENTSLFTTIWERYLSHILKLDGSDKISRAFAISEKTKSRLLTEKIQAASEGISFGLPDTLRKKEHLLESLIAEMEKLQYQEKFETESPNVSSLRIYEDSLFKLRRDRDKLLHTFEKNYPYYYNLRYSHDVISVKGTQDSILKDPDQALVEYFVGDSSIYSFIILPDTSYIFDIKLDFPLEQWIKDIRCGIFSDFLQDTTLCGNINSDAFHTQYETAACQLYQKVFAPIDSMLPENTRITIIPDGVLGYLPFEVLLTQDPKDGLTMVDYPFLLRDHTLSYAYSATLQNEMVHKEHRQAPVNSLLALAPSFDSRTASMADSALLATRLIDTTKLRNRLTPLQFNIPEAEALVGIVGGKAIIGHAATEATFRQQAPKYRFLHLSTHGKANAELGDYSFLAFHYLQDSVENEWLYNREIYNLQLNADMVVLSACETGIGELQRGEGIISLARGFSYAGAKSIITSLWSVNDQSTKVLMETFYRNLKEGMSKDQALQKAKLKYLQDYPNLGQEPFFWAAFIPIGDMSPLQLSNDNHYGIWITLVIALLATGLILNIRRHKPA